ncbi:sulfurtransferase [Egbenema bharatensis]|uniref:sulfurtransferase n=1 Tax=Egbenema bharatensis TaxID=3463334 RepID=UPI003A862D69
MNQPNLEDPSSENQRSSVVSAAELFEYLNDDRVVIIDCRFDLAQPQLGRWHYQTSHIPGAFYLDLNQDLSGPVQRHGGRHPLPEPEQLAAKLETIGVRSGNGQSATWVIAYDDSRFAFAARLWWLLRFLGHDRVAVLDGGFAGWQAAGYPVTSEASHPKTNPGTFVPRIQSNWVVDRETVKTQKDKLEIALIDSREAERYRGEREPIDPVAGHISGAMNYPWTEVTNSQGYLCPSSVQKQRWASLAGIQEIIVYCGSGVTACVNLLSLEMAGQNGKLYAGSWSDWCSYL